MAAGPFRCPRFVQPNLMEDLMGCRRSIAYALIGLAVPAALALSAGCQKEEPPPAKAPSPVAPTARQAGGDTGTGTSAGTGSGTSAGTSAGTGAGPGAGTASGAVPRAGTGTTPPSTPAADVKPAVPDSTSVTP